MVFYYERGTPALSAHTEFKPSASVLIKSSNHLWEKSGFGQKNSNPPWEQSGFGKQIHNPLWEKSGFGGKCSDSLWKKSGFEGACMVARDREILVETLPIPSTPVIGTTIWVRVMDLGFGV